MIKLILLLFLFVTLHLKSFAGNIIQDAETEEYLREIINPILTAAKIEPKSVSIFIVNDENINAFVSGGMNIFVNTGLIQSSKSYNVVEGVLAHEIGHISGAHIVAYRTKTVQSLLTAAPYLLAGIAASTIGGNSRSASDAIAAGVLAGGQVATRQMLSFSRDQEREADDYAVLYLKKTQSSASGLISLFEILETMQKKLLSTGIDKYSTTHPLTQERIDYIKSNGNFSFKQNKILEEKHTLLLAKFAGFFGNEDKYIYYSKEYQKNKDAIMYKKSFELSKEGKYFESNKLLLELVKKHPQNPYFAEVLAQNYSLTGNLEMAQKTYQQIIELKPENFDFLYQYGLFLLEKKQDAKEALTHLTNALVVKNNNILALEAIKKAQAFLGKHDISLVYAIKCLIEKGEKEKALTKIAELQERVEEKKVKEEDLEYIKAQIETLKDLTLKL